MRPVGVKKIFNLFYGISFIMLAATIVIAVNVHQRRQALVEAEEKARLILDHNLAIHTYYSKQLKPRLFEYLQLQQQDPYFEPAWMSSTYAVREIDRYYGQLGSKGYYYKECAINARTPANEADEYERAVLEEMKKNPSLVHRTVVREIDGQPFLTILRRGESMESGCLRCHSVPAAAPGDLVKRYGPQRSFGRSAGELVSAISIRIPLEQAYADANRFSLTLSLLLLAALGLSNAVTLHGLRRLLVQPLTMIRNRANEIVSDDSKLGEEIPSRFFVRELSDFSHCFNDLSRHLAAEREALVEKVRQRTAELQSANDELQREIGGRRQVQAELADKVAELESALHLVKQLEGIIPICMYCKKIRDDEQSWQQLEKYITEHSEASFSHGMCPDCEASFRARMQSMQVESTD